jgi:hypothetical protein
MQNPPQGAGQAPTPRRQLAQSVPTPRACRILGSDARLAVNDEDPAPAGDLTRAEVDAIADDLAYAAYKESPQRDRDEVARAERAERLNPQQGWFR